MKAPGLPFGYRLHKSGVAGLAYDLYKPGNAKPNPANMHRLFKMLHATALPYYNDAF